MQVTLQEAALRKLDCLGRKHWSRVGSAVETSSEMMHRVFCHL